MDCVFDVDELGAPERRRSNKQRYPGRLGHHHPKTNGQLCCLSRVTRHAGWPEHFGAHFKRCGFTIDARDTDNVGQRRQSHSTEHTHAAIWKHRRFEQVAQHASIVDRCTNPKSGRHLDDVAIDPMTQYPLRCVFLAWVWMATCLPLMSVANERPGVQSQSGNAFLSPSMQAMQNDTKAKPYGTAMIDLRRARSAMAPLRPTRRLRINFPNGLLSIKNSSIWKTKYLNALSEPLNLTKI